MTRNKDAGSPGTNDEGTGRFDLQAARESLGLTLDDLFQQTRISVSNLQAIETRNFQSLPPPVYTKAFIRQYARTIGVDEKVILDQYEKYLKAIEAPPRPAEENKKPWKLVKLNYKTLVPLLSIVIIGAVVFILSLYNKSAVDVPYNPLPPQKPVTTVAPETLSPAAPPPKESMATETIDNKGASPTLSPPSVVSREDTSAAESRQGANGKTRSVLNTTAVTPNRIVIEARELTWLRIRSDQDPPYHVTLKPGEKLERQARTSFTLDIGNAGGVDIRLQDRPLGSLGRSGEVIHIKLP